jgi:prepilin-type N-terminal cleavage/methylation domain-containing protein
MAAMPVAVAAKMPAARGFATPNGSASNGTGDAMKRSGQWSVVSGRWNVESGIPFPVPRRPSPVPRAAFTLVELLVTITIIGMMAGLVLGAMSAARQASREAATKATIAKLNSIIMKRYESYLTRRVPVSLSGLPPAQAAENRLYAIRDIMRMEMPDRFSDINSPPIPLPNRLPDGTILSVPRPALSQLYANRLNTSPPGAGNGTLNDTAELLYMIVSMGSPEAMEQFSQSEIGDTNQNGYPEFLDGWGRPIFFLRWAPGYSPFSNVQVADPVKNHDPFDPRRADQNAYHLIPLIYSAGSNGEPGLNINAGFDFTQVGSKPGDIFVNGWSEFSKIGTPVGGNGVGNIDNHHIEAR